jgi:hypothetical protein
MPNKRPEFPVQQFDSSVVEHLEDTSGTAMTFYFAGVADSITPWGQNVPRRDKELSEFWPSENTLASAIYSISSRNAAFEWEVVAQPRTRDAIEWMLHNAIVGNARGWIPFISSFSQDLYTRDNGAFIEIIRAENSPSAPVIGIGHLDSTRCTRTGNPEYPVIYTDRKGREHKMPWYSIVPISEFPSSLETMNGVGYSAVTRVLRAAQILKDLAIYKQEKVSGRFYKAIHFVGGVSRREIEDIKERGQEDADNAGLRRYILPQIVASLDPEKAVSVATIDLAGLPDNFDLDIELKWYITQLALGLGEDYQSLAPLPGGNLGTSTQSEILHKKSRGKGPALFMEIIQNTFKWCGILPRSAKFHFVSKDTSADKETAEVALTRARERQIRIQDGEITTDVARKLALIAHDLTEEMIGDIPEGFNMAEQDASSTPTDNDVEEGLGGDTNRVRRI